MTQLTTTSGTQKFGPGYPTLLINDQLRVIDQDASLLDELKLGDIQGMLKLAYRGKQAGIVIKSARPYLPDGSMGIFFYAWL